MLGCSYPYLTQNRVSGILRKMFPTHSDWVEEPLIFEHDQILDDLLAECSGPTTNKKAKIEEKKSKKGLHRDVEKQRRQEMAGLYASLRSLLPLEYVKGKRAISDHMQQAVAYIKDMQKNIDEMKARRDGLRAAGAAVGAHRNASCSVEVNVEGDGVEILIGRTLNRESFPLSQVLSFLLGRGLHVISCVSTGTAPHQHQSSLHKLQIQVDETAMSFDPSELQDRLFDLLNTGSWIPA